MSATRGEPDATLQRAEERIFTAIAARDVAALETELADDFIHTAIGGAEQDRSVFIAGIRHAPYRILEIRGEGLRVRSLGEHALVSGVQHARVSLPDGSVVNAATAFVDLFVRSGTRWLLRYAWSVETQMDARA